MALYKQIKWQKLKDNNLKNKSIYFKMDWHVSVTKYVLAIYYEFRYAIQIPI